MVITFISVTISMQLLIDLPNQDVLDVKDIPGFYPTQTL